MPEQGRSQSEVRHVIGCMTGTSIDGLDVSLVRLEGRGLDMRATCVAHASFEFPEGLQSDLRRAARQLAMTAAEFARLALEFGDFHAECLTQFTSDQPKSADLVAVHGQTVFHDPPCSWQLINPNPIACALRCPVVFDLRAADLAAGGEGAPMTPIADWILFRSRTESRAILNLGGFANYTLLPASTSIDAIRAGDICACNQLLDRVSRMCGDQPFDQDGRMAADGEPIAKIVDAFTELIAGGQSDQRSMGTLTERTLDSALATVVEKVEPADAMRSATVAVAQVIGAALQDAEVDQLLVAGGSVRNDALLGELRLRLPEFPVERTDEFGVPFQYRESTAMAVLGALSQDRLPITLPHVTGCQGERAPVAGIWVYPP